MFKVALFLLDMFFPVEEEKKLSESKSSKTSDIISIRYGSEDVYNSAKISKKISFPGDRDQFLALISFGHDPRNRFTITRYNSIDDARSDVIKVLTNSSFDGIDEYHLIKGMCYVPLPPRINRNSPRRERRSSRSPG